MQEQAAVEELRQRLGEVWDLEAAAAVLDWDQQVNMPAAGNDARAEALATVRRLAHERLASPRIGELLEGLEAAGELDPHTAALLKATRRAYERAVRVPSDLVARLSQATGVGYLRWLEARTEGRFELFQPALGEIVAVLRDVAAAVGEGTLYDSLLYLNEPGTDTATLEQLFARLKDVLVPLAEALYGKPVPPSPFAASFAAEGQLELCRRAAAFIGFDFERGRLDQSAHPFTTAFDVDDVRITTRVLPDDLGSALFAALHEAGHGLYEQGLPREARGTPLCRAISSGVHESQSRLWENMVGRSLAFWQAFLPQARAIFPQRLGRIDVAEVYRGVNRVRPSLIRVEADEVSYNLHILLRFELERALLSGELSLADLPGAWAERTNAYFGLVPRDDAWGVLQDIHWAGGGFAVFPSYTLGNVIAAQLLALAPGDWQEAIARGDASVLRTWLEAHLYRHGARYTLDEWLSSEFGQSLDPEPFLTYITTKYRTLYDL